MAASGDQSEGLNAINITPMVDVVLVLLVIFMVTTAALNQAEALEIDRPDAATGKPAATDPAQVLLTCVPDGGVTIDSAPVESDAEILAAIRQRKAADADLQGVITCDEEARIGALVRLLDLLRQAGVTKYAITTEQPQDVRG